MSPTISYNVSMPEPHSHLYHVRLVLEGLDVAPLRLAMPVWTPGSYLVREFARHVQDLALVHGESVSRADKRTWVVAPRGGRIEVTYQVYANELSVRTNHLDGTHGFIQPGALFFDVEGLAVPFRITVEPPLGWSVFTSLPMQDGAFVARDIDTLVDSPIEVGPHPSWDFEVLGAPHQLVIAGDGNWDVDAMQRDFPRIIEEAARIFGGELPYERYVFILLTAQGIRGGLEHLDSAVLAWGALNFQPKKRYEEFLRLVAHEFFHVWNIKRIRPSVLGPFDYSAENYTRTLWLHEGGTVYYEGLVPVRAGVLRVQTWLDEVADSIKQLEAQPGRLHMSVAESSFAAWVKLYRRDEHTRNCTISYYLKGELVCLLLDQAIRERTGGAKSLDDVMRHLYALTAPPRAGYPEEQLAALFHEASGVEVGDLFAAFVDGTDELPIDRALAWYGLEVQRKQKGTGDEDIAPSQVGWLGVDVAMRDGRALVTSVTEGAPAWTHGLYFDDEVLALDGYRVDAASLGERLKVRRPGDTVVLTVARRERIREVELVLGERPADDVKVVPRADATDEQKARFQAWIGQAFPAKATVTGGGAA